MERAAGPAGGSGDARGGTTTGAGGCDARGGLEAGAGGCDARGAATGAGGGAEERIGTGAAMPIRVFARSGLVKFGRAPGMGVASGEAEGRASGVLVAEGGAEARAAGAADDVAAAGGAEGMAEVTLALVATSGAGALGAPQSVSMSSVDGGIDGGVDGEGVRGSSLAAGRGGTEDVRP